MLKIIHMRSQPGYEPSVDERVLRRDFVLDERSLLDEMLGFARNIAAQLTSQGARTLVEVVEPKYSRERYPHVVIHSDGRDRDVLVVDEY